MSKVLRLAKLMTDRESLQFLIFIWDSFRENFLHVFFIIMLLKWFLFESLYLQNAKRY